MSVVNVGNPVNVKASKKNINISSKTLTNPDKSLPNCDIFTEAPALKHNSNSKLNSDISKNLLKSSDSKALPDTPESQKSVHEVSPATE